MKNKVKKFVGLLLTCSLIVAACCSTAFAGTTKVEGYSNGIYYSARLDRTDRAFYGSLSTGTSARLQINGSATAELGDSSYSVPIGASGTGTSITTPTKNPPNDSLAFVRGSATYKVNGVTVEILTA